MCGTPSPVDQHLLPPSEAREGHVDAPSVGALAAAGLWSRPEKLEDLHAPDYNGTVEARWCQMRNVIQSTALEVLGRAHRQHQDCFVNNDVEKNELHKAYMDLRTDATKVAFFRCRRLVRQRLQKMQDAWMIRNAEEIQGYADRNEMKNLFQAIKAIYSPCIKGTTLLLSSDGTTLLTEKSRILKRWAKHFRSVLNCSSVISDAAIDRLPQMDKKNDLNLPPALPETIRAVQQISSGKAPGSDAIPPEVYKHGKVSKDIKDATIVHLYKRKGNRKLCDNHRGISLLNIAGKIFARILRNHLNGHLEQGLLPESQCGFRRHRGTTDMIFAARELQDKCQEMRTHLYTTFVDLTKAFDTLNHDGLWKFMQKFGCPERFTHMAAFDFGLTISTAKTVVMHQLQPSAENNATRINVNRAQLKNVENYAYLGNTMSRNTRINYEVAQRISKASQAYGQLQASMWNRHAIHLNTKLKIYKTVVLTTVLYGAETWTVFSNQARKLYHFHPSCLRIIMKLRWQYRNLNMEVLEWAPQNTEAEMARQDPGHGSPGAELRRILKLRWQDRIPDTEVLERTGILSIHHAEASATAMERPPGKNGRRATSQTTFGKCNCDGAATW
ncbi:unnamed protein product [Schistocephalus solidus]|uniref:Reverse transcriptase domain-containing protein n=1 Tax=Schistocephalus solidus TaxID=70667 RepID=A0A183TBJ9_SCHSO|nr:unnamed protein product [Schistocephalus solidus]